MMASRVILLTASLLAAGCSDSSEDEGARAESHQGAEPVAEPQPAESQAGEGRDGEEAAPAEPEGEPLEVVVKESHLLSSIPTADQTVLHAVVDEGILEVHVEHLEAACGPVPEIEARLAPPKVVLRLVPAEDRTCIGRQEIKLRIDLPRRADVDTVELRGADGRPLVSVDVPS